MKRKVFFCCCISILGCGDRGRSVEEITPHPIIVKHCYASDSNDAWQVEVWLNATIQGSSEPVNMSVRITPKSSLTSLPGVEMRLRLRGKDGKTHLEKVVRPVFEPCKKDRSIKETVYRYRKGYGPETPIPTGTCWQAFLENSFQSDGHAKKAVPLRQGVLIIEAGLRIEDGAKFSIELPELRVTANP